MRTKTLYKSLPANMSPHGHKFETGKWYKENNISICNRGFHASKRAIDAMSYVPCEVLAKVKVQGEHEEQSDKECWSEIIIEKTYKWTKKDSVALSIFAAELVLKNFEKLYPNDKRPREALEAAKAVLKNDTEKNRSAAESAAESARSAAWSAWSAARSAWSAARSAWSAARSAAESAAESAWSAAESAAESARSAAWSERAKQKMLDKIEKWIHERIGF